MNRILVINVGDYWRDNAKASVLHAAARWGAHVVEDNLAGDVLLRKFWMNTGERGDRWLYLDADMVVRSDCPSPFDLVPPSHFGAVRNFQGDTHRGDGNAEKAHRPAWERVCERYKVGVPFDLSIMVNGGLLLWTAGVHDEVFRLQRQAWSGVLMPHPVEEQSSWPLAFALANVPVCYLPRGFNRIGESVWNSGPEMTEYVYHFASYYRHRGDAKRNRIDACKWNIKVCV